MRGDVGGNRIILSIFGFRCFRKDRRELVFIVDVSVAVFGVRIKEELLEIREGGRVFSFVGRCGFELRVW